MSVLIRRED